MEELHECEVMWPEENYYQNARSVSAWYKISNPCPKIKRQEVKNSSATAPMGIPGARQSCTRGHCSDEEEEEIMPPHVMASRSRSGEKMEFSVCSGQGRTLKGRDLKHVRDSVLRMTGFLEV